MCKRRNPDPLAEIFLRNYRMNLLKLPGNRVRCGSVYVKQNKALAAPGDLADLVEPALQLPSPYAEKNLPDLRGTWSKNISTKVSIGLLENFLAALGAPALIDKLRASAEHGRTRSISFRFADAERDSISPTALAAALEDHRFRARNAWVQAGNQYFVAAAVVRSPSISVRAHDDRSNVIDFGGELATVATADGSVKVERSEDNAITYRGKVPIGFAVELYELLWDGEREMLAFNTPNGPQPVVGFEATQRPDSVFVGEDDEAIVEFAPA